MASVGQDEPPNEAGLADAPPLLELNPALDRAALAQELRENSRIQVADVLTPESALSIQHLLKHGTSWDLAWRLHGGHRSTLAASVVDDPSGERKATIERFVQGSLSEKRGLTYICREIVLGERNPEKAASPHGSLFKSLNSQDFLQFLRDISGVPEIIRLSARGTLYEPGHFLSIHHDGAADGRHLAYVLNLGTPEWRADWGGYLLFYNAAGDVVQGFKPRFNSLNLFRVPQSHSVSLVTSSAPVGRYAVSGWVHDRIPGEQSSGEAGAAESGDRP